MKKHIITILITLMVSVHIAGGQQIKYYAISDNQTVIGTTEVSFNQLQKRILFYLSYKATGESKNGEITGPIKYYIIFTYNTYTSNERCIDGGRCLIKTTKENTFELKNLSRLDYIDGFDPETGGDTLMETHLPKSSVVPNSYYYRNSSIYELSEELAQIIIDEGINKIRIETTTGFADFTFPTQSSISDGRFKVTQNAFSYYTSKFMKLAQETFYPELYF